MQDFAARRAKRRAARLSSDKSQDLVNQAVKGKAPDKSASDTATDAGNQTRKLLGRSSALDNVVRDAPRTSPAPGGPGVSDGDEDDRRVGTRNGRPYTMGQARSAIDDAISGRSLGAGAHVADHPSEGPPPPARRGPSGEDTQRMVNDAVSGRSPASSYGPQRKRRLSQVSS